MSGLACFTVVMYHMCLYSFRKHFNLLSILCLRPPLGQHSPHSFALTYICMYNSHPIIAACKHFTTALLHVQDRGCAGMVPQLCTISLVSHKYELCVCAYLNTMFEYYMLLHVVTRLYLWGMYMILVRLWYRFLTTGSYLHCLLD